MGSACQIRWPVTILIMAWVHNLDPFAIQFTETFGLRWYGLAYLAGLAIGYLITLRMTKRGATLFKPEQLPIMSLTAPSVCWPEDALATAFFILRICF